MKIGVIGAGVIGALRARTVAESAATELVGVVDVSKAAAEKAAGGAKAYVDHRAMLDAGGLDAVIVSSPVQFHEEHCQDAFDAGLHVLCEKPLSNSAAGARKIFDAAGAAGQTLATGFNCRYYPSIQYLMECVRGGRIGKLDHVRVFGGHDGLHNFRADWQYKGELSGGGAMMDVGIHMTDLARHVAGEITSVYGVATNNVWNVDKSEDNAMAVFRTEAGPSVFYQATWTEWRGYGFFVDAYGDRGMIRGYYAPMFNMLVAGDQPTGPRKKSYKLYPEIIFREKVKGWETTTLQTFVEELADFLRMVKGETTDLADGWSGFRAVEIAEAVYRSQRENVVVELCDRPA